MRRSMTGVRGEDEQRGRRENTGSSDGRDSASADAAQDARTIEGARPAPEAYSSTIKGYEAYLKLIDINQVVWQDRSHFLAMASRAMRRLLVDHARLCRARKRGGGYQRVAMEDVRLLADDQVEPLLALEAALQHLTRLAPPDGPRPGTACRGRLSGSARRAPASAPGRRAGRRRRTRRPAFRGATAWPRCARRWWTGTCPCP
ncbi:MAG: hypothetical protein D6685_11200 [Bacteroidetes bacterium]|nr:MAG: hypothetical protein D6685_11200 [Bacteroidota bacterium]